MTAKDLAKKIDGYRALGPYVLLNAKEAKRVAVELRKADRLSRKAKSG